MTDTFDPSVDLPENLSEDQNSEQQLLEAQEQREELELMHMVELGEDAKAFLASPIGHEMVARARDIITDCALDLVQTPVSETNKIVELQITARSAQLFMVLVNNIASDGQQAYQELVSKFHR
jgi:hypothetical protein